MEDFTLKYEKLYVLASSYHNKEVIKSRLRFHNWAYTEFVIKKSKIFAQDLGADIGKTTVSALMYGIFSPTSIKQTRSDVVEIVINMITEAGFTPEFAHEIFTMNENIKLPGRLARKLTLEEQALSDAVSLIRVLPMTPVVFASKYIEQVNLSIEELMQKIISEQESAIATEKLFYSEKAKYLYNKWAKTHLELWTEIKDSLKDPDISTLLDDSLEYRQLLGEYKIAIGVIILNEKREVLIAQRGKEVDNNVGSWEIIYGRIHQGEAPEDAVRREALEEVGLHVTPKHIVGLNNFYRTKNDLEHVAIVYLATADNDKVVNLQKEEVAAFKWVPIEDVVPHVADHDKKQILSAIKLLDSLKESP